MGNPTVATSKNKQCKPKVKLPKTNGFLGPKMMGRKEKVSYRLLKIAIFVGINSFDFYGVKQLPGFTWEVQWFAPSLVDFFPMGEAKIADSRWLKKVMAWKSWVFHHFLVGNSEFHHDFSRFFIIIQKEPPFF